MHSATVVCVCVRTPGSDPSLGRRAQREVLLINPNFLRTPSLGPPAALRSRAFTQTCLTKISGLGQTARLIRADSSRQTTQTYSPPSNLFSKILPHTCTYDALAKKIIQKMHPPPLPKHDVLHSHACIC